MSKTRAGGGAGNQWEDAYFIDQSHKILMTRRRLCICMFCSQRELDNFEPNVRYAAMLGNVDRRTGRFFYKIDFSDRLEFDRSSFCNCGKKFRFRLKERSGYCWANVTHTHTRIRIQIDKERQREREREHILERPRIFRGGCCVRLYYDIKEVIALLVIDDVDNRHQHNDGDERGPEQEPEPNDDDEGGKRIQARNLTMPMLLYLLQGMHKARQQSQ
ncbi:hypothetical protein Trydic_g12676 [Trypoxylus dichotomus]